MLYAPMPLSTRYSTVHSLTADTHHPATVTQQLPATLINKVVYV